MIEEISDAIRSIPVRARDIGSGNRAWTQAVKSAFIELGRKHRWTVCASSAEEGVEPEWLYDLCWYSRTEAEDFHVGLVLESEWARDYYDLRFDFEKLLCAKAPYKVFIFEAYDDALDQNLAALELAIKRCKFPSHGEIFVLAAYQPARGEFKIQKVEGA